MHANEAIPITSQDTFLLISDRTRIMAFKGRYATKLPVKIVEVYE
jgi:hypothetical protein